MKSLPEFSVENPVLVNLLMWAILVGGSICAFTLVREMFPESTPNQIRITTVYPGATPAEVEKGISARIEEAVRDIEGIDEIHTTIGEGLSEVRVVLFNNVDDVDQVVNEVKNALDTIPRDDFPTEAEETRVQKVEIKLPVINVAYSGDLDDRTLKVIGRKLRDDILAIPGITDAVLLGTLRDEISIEVRPEKLIEYRLSIEQVSDAVARANLDLPGGQIRTPDANVSVRTLGEKEEARAISRIIVRSDASGGTIRLSDLSEVKDGFEDAEIVSRFNSRPAVNVTVYKSADQDAIEMAHKIQAFVAGKTRQPLERGFAATLKHRLGFRDEIDRVYENAWNNPYPWGGQMQTSTNLARFIEGRLNLLKRNGTWGLMLVFVSLLAFLNWRVALWVMIGLLLAILGTLICMQFLGITLNLITMFGMIVVLGLLVDDAIIVGENVYAHVERGVNPKEAAVIGTREVTWPVVCAIATTVVAFAPLIFIEGQIGDFMGMLPIIVLCALGVSLFESLSILPSHLAAGLKPARPVEQTGDASVFERWQSKFRAAQAHFLSRILLKGYERLLRKALAYRYVTMATLVALLIAAGGLVACGRVPIVFVQKTDSETLIASLKMPIGTPISRTDAAVRVIESAAMKLPELESMYSLAGAQYGRMGGTAGLASHLGQIIIEISPTEERERTSEDILRVLRAECGNIPGVNALSFDSVQGGPGGAAMQIEISGERLDDLITLAERVKDRLAGFRGVFDIVDDLDAGRREVQIELLDSARALGITTQSLATQVRGAFYGIDARKIQRGREDVKIMVRYPREHRQRIYDVESMWISAGDGTPVPFSEVARLREGRSYASIHRIDQQRTVTIVADVDQATGNAEQISASLSESFSAWEREFPGVRLRFGGQRREFARSFGSLKRDFFIALLLIYVILAGMFRSYVQPVIVMAAIPFGVIGVVAGHLLMGFPITILSLIGMVALTGIVVNDSLILVNFINKRRMRGETALEAVVAGARGRMRAILLTSITTVLGLAPLMLETSFQARFLIPMGISIAYGLAFATVLTLVGVPCLYLMTLDAKHVTRWAWGFLTGSGAGPAPAPGTA